MTQPQWPTRSKARWLAIGTNNTRLLPEQLLQESGKREWKDGRTGYFFGQGNSC